MITIKGQTPSHKNSKQLFRVKGRPLLANNRKYLEWRDSAEWDIVTALEPRRPSPVTVRAVFYVDSQRARDLDNMMASVLDVLVAAGQIEDDNCFKCKKIEAEFGGIDRDNPRAEVFIK